MASRLAQMAVGGRGYKRHQDTTGVCHLHIEDGYVKKTAQFGKSMYRTV